MQLRTLYNELKKKSIDPEKEDYYKDLLEKKQNKINELEELNNKYISENKLFKDTIKNRTNNYSQIGLK